MTTIYLGATADKEHVYAEIQIEAGSGQTVEFTDHTTGLAPERISISFVLLAKHYANPSAAPDAYWLSGGQVDAASRVIVAPAIPLAQIAAIESAWISSHLNDLNAACDHMTPEMLVRRDGESVSDWQGRMLDTVVCPVTGYKWGRAWLAKTVEPATVAVLREITEQAR